MGFLFSVFYWCGIFIWTLILISFSYIRTFGNGNVLSCLFFWLISNSWSLIFCYFVHLMSVSCFWIQLMGSLAFLYFNYLVFLGGFTSSVYNIFFFSLFFSFIISYIQSNIKITATKQTLLIALLVPVQILWIGEIMKLFNSYSTFNIQY